MMVMESPCAYPQTLSHISVETDNDASLLPQALAGVSHPAGDPDVSAPSYLVPLLIRAWERT